MMSCVLTEVTRGRFFCLVSSYSTYLGNTEDLVDTELALGMIGLDEFVRYHHEESSDSCLEDTVTKRMTDEEARGLIKSALGYKNLSTIQALAIPKRNDALRKLKEEGLSIRQISRLTGISKTIVERA